MSLRTWALLIAVLGLATAVRFSGIMFGPGMPDVLAIHPDESGVATAIRALRHGNVEFFVLAYGGGYALPLEGFARVVAALGGPNAWGPDTFGATFDAIVTARLWSALLSTLTVGLVFAIGRSVEGPASGVSAAFLLASSTLAIRDAHIGKADSAATLAAALVLWAMVRPVRTRIGALFGLGVTTGIALSIKYLIGLLPAVTATAVQLARSDRRTAARALAWCAIVTAVTVGCLNYFWLTMPAQSWAFLRYLADFQLQWGQAPHFAGRVTSPLRYHLAVSLLQGCGLGFVCALPAVGYALWNRGSAGRIALGVVGQFGVLLANPLVLARNFEPLLPGICVLIAVAIDRAAAVLLPTPPVRRFAILVATLAIGGGPLLDGARLAWVLRQEDTRTLATRWIEDHVPTDAPITCLTAAPAFMECPAIRRILGSPRRDGGDHYVVRASYPAPFVTTPDPPGGRAERVMLFDPFPGPGAAPVIEPLDLFLLPLARFEGVTHPGPLIEIFRVPAGDL